MTGRSHATVEAFDRDVLRNRGYLYTTNARLSSKLANQRLTEAALAATDFKDKRVLDVGCGDGTYTFDLFEGGHPRSIYGFDPAEEAVSVARQKISGRPIAFAAHDAYAVPLESDSFDVAHLRGVLHHLDRPVEVLREALRLAPRLIVIEPNGYNLALKCVEKLSRYHREHGERSYAPSTLDRWVRKVGGRVREHHFVGLVPFFCPDWLARVLKSAERSFERTPVLNAACCAVYLQLVERDG
jgi:ubiquinone/menaquinone biosynthesis C-methylase UbiE